MELMEKIHDSNQDLAERAEASGLTAELDATADTLKITIGLPDRLSYSQRVGAVTVRLDDETDQILGFTVTGVTGYAEAHPGLFEALLPALRRFRTITLPPRTAGAGLVAHELKDLVPA
jgi:hypothetical protein